VKPYAMQFLLNCHGPENIVYFDPDILLYSSLDSILQQLQTHSFLLTPHLMSPLREDRRPSELDILRSIWPTLRSFYGKFRYDGQPDRGSRWAHGDTASKRQCFDRRRDGAQRPQ